MEKAEKVTNFPGSGDDQKISLSNSKFLQFPYDYAATIKESYPEVWKKGGNEFGNQAFVLWGKARGGDDTEAVKNWIKRRERFINRHQNDFRLAGVVAVMKWGGVVNKGLSHMKVIMNEAKEKDKTEKADTWERAVSISKTDDEQQLVFGWLSVAVDKAGKPVLDLQGDIIAPEELEKAAYDYVLFARNVGEMHNRTEGVGRLVESMVFTKQKQEALGIPAGTLPETAWWIGYKIDDPEVWKKVKSGEYRAFSIGGRAKRKPVEGDET